MIRQELADKIGNQLNLLKDSVDLNNHESIRFECSEAAYKLGIEIAELVGKELDDQRQDIDMVMAYEYGLPSSDFEQYKSYCEENGLKPSSGQVLNEYMKERGV